MADPFTKEYRLETTPGGGRLRVALDVLMDYRADGRPHTSADERRNFKLEVIGGSGSVLQEVGTGYSAEAYVCFDGDPCKHSFPCPAGAEVCGMNDQIGRPVFDCDAQRCYVSYGLSSPEGSAGTWTIRVQGDDIDSWTYRMRAILEPPAPEPAASDSTEPLFPNLRARPPFELTLDCTPAMGYGAFVRRGVCGTGAIAAVGAVPPGCSAQEVAEFPEVEWCLRFSGGNENAGEGGFEIVASNATPSTDGKIHAEAQQIIRSRDETEVARLDAGELVFEDSHGHWHYEGFMQYELFKVRPAGNKVVEPPLEGLKRGWCPADEFLGDWRSFSQVPKSSGPETAIDACFFATPNAVFGQSAGWGDIYEWAREEQFVPIEVDELTGLPVAGEYVLRETIDPAGLLTERDEDDNTAYAYFEVLNDGSLRIKERGYGDDPWGPHKPV